MEQNNQNFVSETPNVLNADITNANSAAFLPAKPIKSNYALHDALTAWGCLLLGFVFTRCVAGAAGSLWGGIFWAAVGVLAAVYAKLKKLKTTRLQAAVWAAAEIFCAVPLFSSNVFTNTLAAFFSFMLIFYLALTVSGAAVFGEHFVRDFFSALLIRPFKSFGKAPSAAVSLFKGGKHAKTLVYILIGLCLALPLTLIVVPLLMRSDRAFENAMSSIISCLPSLSGELIVQFIFAIPVGFFLFGMMFSMLNPVEKRQESAPAYRFLPSVAAYSAVTPICVFYLIYILSQLQYLTAAFGGKLPDGLSFSEYARKGFFELCAVAAINLFVIIAMQAFTRRAENDLRPKALRIYTIILCAFSLLLTVCAFSKMALYIRSMGMTPLRVYTSWFMLIMAVAFVVITIQQLREIKLWRIMFAAFTVMMGILCFGNVDGIIARYNYTHYESGEITSLDAKVLGNCGFSGAEYLVKAIEGSDSEVYTLYFQASLAKIEKQLENKSGFEWFSIPRLRAQGALEEYYELSIE